MFATVTHLRRLQICFPGGKLCGLLQRSILGILSTQNNFFFCVCDGLSTCLLGHVFPGALVSDLDPSLLILNSVSLVTRFRSRSDSPSIFVRVSLSQFFLFYPSPSFFFFRVSLSQFFLRVSLSRDFMYYLAPACLTALTSYILLLVPPSLLFGYRHPQNCLFGTAIFFFWYRHTCAPAHF